MNNEFKISVAPWSFRFGPVYVTFMSNTGRNSPGALYQTHYKNQNQLKIRASCISTDVLEGWNCDKWNYTINKTSDSACSKTVLNTSEGSMERRQRVSGKKLGMTSQVSIDDDKSTRLRDLLSSTLGKIRHYSNKGNMSAINIKLTLK